MKNISDFLSQIFKRTKSTCFSKKTKISKFSSIFLFSKNIFNLASDLSRSHQEAHRDTPCPLISVRINPAHTGTAKIPRTTIEAIRTIQSDLIKIHNKITKNHIKLAKIYYLDYKTGAFVHIKKIQNYIVLYFFDVYK